MLWLLSTVPTILEEKDSASLCLLVKQIQRGQKPTGKIQRPQFYLKSWDAQLHAGPAPYSRGSHWSPLFLVLRMDRTQDQMGKQAEEACPKLEPPTPGSTPRKQAQQQTHTALPSAKHSRGWTDTDTHKSKSHSGAYKLPKGTAFQGLMPPFEKISCEQGTS